jgi:hypothetical protein
MLFDYAGWQYEASYNGHTDTLSLLLLNKADLKAATEVRQLNNTFQKLKTISNYLQGEAH